jgi:aconitate hydratase
MPRRRACGATGAADPVFTDTLELDLGDVVPSMAGPKRPEGPHALEGDIGGFAEALEDEYKKPGRTRPPLPVEGEDYDSAMATSFIAAITSCTNTSNPSVLIGAGLVAKQRAKGLTQAVGEDLAGARARQVVADYLEAAGLQDDLDALGFNLVGYRLHHLHRQLRPAADPDLQDHQRQGT